MPTPYHTLSDDTLNLLAERGNVQALMELAHRAERLGILAEAQELANRLRVEKTNYGRCPGTVDGEHQWERRENESTGKTGMKCAVCGDCCSTHQREDNGND